MQSEITYDFNAFITLIPTENGGRKKPVYNGYKPSFSFNTQKHYCGEIELLDSEELLPGHSAMVLIKLLPATHIRHNIEKGDAFTILEGNKIIGTGVIKKVEKALVNH